MFLAQKLSRWPPFFILEMGFASVILQLCWILSKNFGNFSHDGNTLSFKTAYLSAFSAQKAQILRPASHAFFTFAPPPPKNIFPSIFLPKIQVLVPPLLVSELRKKNDTSGYNYCVCETYDESVNDVPSIHLNVPSNASSLRPIQ